MSEELSFRELIRRVAEERGLDLRGYKPSSLQRRVRKRMTQVGVGSFADYLEFVRSNPSEVNALLNTVLINVTEFFRDPEAWETLGREALPRILDGLRPGDSLRGWSAGCASGEEPYSLAILLADHLGPRLAEFDIKIYANDIDEDALNVARRGEYPAERLRQVRPEWKERYFTGNRELRVNREIRRMVIFGCSNLVTDAPISHCNVVLCRNVLIYFGVTTQRRILARLHSALEPGGILLLGRAESRLDKSRLFRPLNSRWRIFQKLNETAGESASQR